MRIVILGPPGAGKGTQAEIISKEYGIPQISTGDIFRRAIRTGTKLGREVETYMTGGKLVPDEMVIALVQERLSEEDCQAGFILDGFPRTLSQALALECILSSKGEALDVVIEILSAKEAIMERLGSRRICPDCNAVYNLKNKPPKIQGLCDQCGGTLYQRDDDKRETIEKRLIIYEETVKDLRDYYVSKGLLAEFHGDREIHELYSDIGNFLEKKSKEGLR